MASTDDLERMMMPSAAEVAVTGMYRLQERISVCLDVAWMLAVALGVGWAAWVSFGPVGVAAGGGVLCLLSQTAAWLRAREPKPEPKPALASVKPLPGPTDSGNLHVSGR